MKTSEKAVMRWTAKVTFHSEQGDFSNTFDFDEIRDLHGYVEAGPSFKCLKKIEVTYNFGELKSFEQTIQD